MLNAPISGRLLLAAFDVIYLIALAAWTGSVLFCSFAVLPLARASLGPEAGGRFESALLPKYYAWCATAGAIALAAYVCGALSVPELRGHRVAVQIVLILAGVLMMLYGGNSLAPAQSAARSAGPAVNDRLRRLRRRARSLDAIFLVIGVTLLGSFVVRPHPTTQGILEPTPQARVRQEEEEYRKNRETGPGKESATDSGKSAPRLHTTWPR